MTPPRFLPAPLFRHICLLAAIAGVWGSRDGLAGLAAALLLWIAVGTLPRARLAAFVLCALAGLGLGALTRPAPEPPDWPDWLNTGVPIRIQGRVAQVSGQPDRRVRMLLDEVRPEGAPDASPLPGRLAWIWDQGAVIPEFRPIPGQTVSLTTRIRPVTGFANEGGTDITAYWAARDVWFNAWSLGGRGQVQVSGRGNWAAALRGRWLSGLKTGLAGLTNLKSPHDEPPSAPAGSTQARGPNAAEASPAHPAPAGYASQARAMLPALLFGDRFDLNSATLDLFTRAGLVHSLALSGQHLALAGTAAALAVWLLILGRPAILLRLPRRALLLLAAAPPSALYLWMGGAPLSLVRAALMLFGAGLFCLTRRGRAPFDALFFAVACLLLAWPQAVFELSVQLSILSVAGIMAALPWLRAHAPAPTPFRRTGRAALTLIIVSLAAQLATLPIILHNFGRLTPLFPLNLLWLPLLELIVLPLAALGALGILLPCPPGISDALFHLATLPGEGLLALLTWLRDQGWLIVAQGLRPLPVAVLGYAAAAAAFVCLSGRRGAKSGAARRLALAAALLLPMGTLIRHAEDWIACREQRVTLRVLDVGQSQALALEWPRGRLLLDGGGSLSPRFDTGRDVVAPALTANRPPRLNMVLASHADLDHVRGLMAILESFDVDAFGRSALPFVRNQDKRGDAARLEDVCLRRRIPLREFRAGDSLDLGGGLRLDIVHPPDQGRFSRNNGSLVARLTLRGQGLALMCGDAQKAALARILKSGVDLRADVLVLPHHGSATSLLPEFYDAVSPRVALVSCGAHNSFGFPRPEVLQSLAERGIPVLSTARHGELRISWHGAEPDDARAPRVTVFRGGPFPWHIPEMDADAGGIRRKAAALPPPRGPSAH
ncbi:MAG: ComEC/Rec2 family competence protein [Desulfovibrionaceae bacterium]|nr:ComEC/Rec2 family competence protein [Desulfovibrionaceae bacterium]